MKRFLMALLVIALLTSVASVALAENGIIPEPHAYIIAK